jgi:hypothetical protein
MGSRGFKSALPRFAEGKAVHDNDLPTLMLRES